MRFAFVLFVLCLMTMLFGCRESKMNAYTSVQTSGAGDKLEPVTFTSNPSAAADTFCIDRTLTKQKITGFGGAFTESSAQLLFGLSESKRNEVIEQYFSQDGANYSLCRTHMNSCDFSIDHYSYAPVEGDTLLEHFSIEPDRADLIPMIKQAQETSKEGFKLVASPWTAPPWMKDNKDWNGGSLLPQYQSVWADFFVRYHQAYASEGIDIWGYTVENEPLGNAANWESMHFTPMEMGVFVKNHLGPTIKSSGIDANILVYDQNRGTELEEWSEVLLTDKELEPFIYGTAVHWYTSTVDWMAESLNRCHNIAPNKHIIHTEGCVDADVPHWNDDEWYWSKEATDWGFDWAPEEDKKDHPKYVPAYRYARDMIGCMNNWVEGWIDWNMVLDPKGGPNLAQNWCVAPVIADTVNDEVYFTPLFYVMSHFSKYVRPEAQVLEVPQLGTLMTTAVENKDGSVVMIVLNQQKDELSFVVELNGQFSEHVIDGRAIQTIIFDA